MQSPEDEVISEIEAIRNPEEKVEAARLAMLGVVTSEVPDPERKVWRHCEGVIRKHFEERYHAGGDRQSGGVGGQG